MNVSAVDTGRQWSEYDQRESLMNSAPIKIYP